MTPAASSRDRRSATAGDDRLTRRPSSASVRRASACSSASRRRFVASRRAPSVTPAFCLRFDAMSRRVPAIGPVVERSGPAACRAMTTEAVPVPARRAAAPAAFADRVPPHAYFVGSAVFHYLGPAFAVLLFARVEVLGVAWLRIASAALVFALWRRPWRVWRALPRDVRSRLLQWGAVLALMNCCFYIAIDRLPLGTVAAIEFLPVVLLAALGARSRRNAGALALAVAGVYLLTGIHISGEPLGLVCAFANAALLAFYIVLPHRTARHPAITGIDGLGLAMLIAAVAVTPIGGPAVVPALTDPVAILAGLGVGVSSSVIPYVADQLAMRELPRATYALMVSLLPATATIIGVVVLAQVPSARELGGVALVIGGVALHREREAAAAGA